MKRFLPFILIALVGLLTIGIATAVYRVKTHPKPVSTASAAATMPTSEGEAENPSLHARGPKDAPVTVEIYGDFQCPACANASRAIDELQTGEFAGKLRVIFHEFPLAMHQHAGQAARAAEAAAIQGKFWEMHDALYKYQDIWSRVNNANYFFESYAEAIGLDVARFRADCISPDVLTRVMEAGKIGEARGVKNTPTIFINGAQASAFTKDALQQAIQSALSGKQGS
jgi:protein-disulfide isomerase